MPSFKINGTLSPLIALILLAACSQNHASQSSSANSMNLSGSPDPELCAGKGPKDTFRFGYMLARETHEAEDANKRHEFRVAFNLARDGRVRARRCGEVANVTNSAYLDNV